MTWLSIDTSLISTAAVGFWFSEQEQLELTLNNPESQEKKLFPLIEAGLAALGRDLTEIEGVAVGVGPGSFTGLRIGIAAAQGLAYAQNLKLAGIPTLDAFEASIPGARETGTLTVPVIDAKMGRVFASIYENGRKITPELDITAADLRERLRSLKPRRVVLAGDALKKYAEILCDLPGVVVSPLPDACPAGLAFCRAALELERQRPDALSAAVSLEPIYLRKSEAEVNLENAQILSRQD